MINGDKKSDTTIRYSLKNFKKDDGLLNIPLFMVDYTEKLLSTLEELKSRVFARCEEISMEEMARDVQPFLFNAGDAKKVTFFVDYLKQVPL